MIPLTNPNMHAVQGFFNSPLTALIPTAVSSHVLFAAQKKRHLRFYLIL